MVITAARTKQIKAKRAGLVTGLAASAAPLSGIITVVIRGIVRIACGISAVIR
jgi:hypothetical protein